MVVVKNLPANSGDVTGRFNHWVRKIPWRQAWQPTPVFLCRESQGQRSLVGYSPWGCKELDTTEWLNLLYGVVIKSPSFEIELFSLSSGLNQLLLHLCRLSVFFCKLMIIIAATYWSCWEIYLKMWVPDPYMLAVSHWWCAFMRQKIHGVGSQFGTSRDVGF